MAVDGADENETSRMAWILHQLLIFITKIPICGGYLASTKNPEQTCLKRFSNEETVPQPCLRRYVCRLFFEHNIVLRTFGRVGFEACERNRKPIMLFAFSLSTIAWFMTISAACAYTNSADNIRNTFWGWGSVDDGSSTYYIGLKQLVLEDTISKGSSATISWEGRGVCDESITFDSKSYGIVTAPDGVVTNCGRCKTHAQGIMRLVVSSCITQVFQMTTDLQRSTRYGDMNCQKLFGTVTSFYGLFSAVGPLIDFRVSCGLRDTLPPWAKTSQLNVTLASGGFEEVDVEFRAGPGYIVLYLALVLKIVDAICHLIVPTPEANHIAPMDGAGLVRIGGKDDGYDHWKELDDYMLLSTDSYKSGGFKSDSDKVQLSELQMTSSMDDPEP
jgi:hypothetical protein